MATANTLFNVYTPTVTNTQNFSTEIAASATRSLFHNTGTYTESSNYTPSMDLLTGDFITRIGKEYFYTHQVKNPFYRHFGGLGDGKDIMMAKVTGNPTDTAYDKTVYDVHEPNVEYDFNVVYAKQNRRSRYKLTIYDELAKPSFNSAAGFNQMISSIFTFFNNGVTRDAKVLANRALASIDFWQGNMMYQTLKFENGKEVDATADLLTGILKVLNDWRFENSTYNEKGELNEIRGKDVILYLHKDLIPLIKINGSLSFLYNEILTFKETAGFNLEIEAVDGFELYNRTAGNTMSNAYALLIERDKYQYFVDLNKTETSRNPANLSTNYFMHVWQTHFVNPFANACVFKAVAGTKTSISTALYTIATNTGTIAENGTAKSVSDDTKSSDETVETETK